MPIIALQNPVPTDIARVPTCAIDLGFSKSDTSVGVAFSPTIDEVHGEWRFGDCVSLVNKWLESQMPECVLIVEAPLTMAMTSQGNPCHRQVELPRNYQKGRSPRSPKGWYYKAGANLSLASSFFLQELCLPNKLMVHLIEGFYCSVSPDEQHARHTDVAAHLLHRIHSLAGQQLVIPISEVDGGTVQLHPGLKQIVSGIPPILLRQGLEIGVAAQ